MSDRQYNHAILADREYCAMRAFSPETVNELSDLKRKLIGLASKRASFGGLGQVKNRLDEAVIPSFGLRDRAVFGPPTGSRFEFHGRSVGYNDLVIHR
jgi:hypothetical protein